MKYSIAILVCAAGCSTDIIEHSSDASGTPDAALADTGPDAGLDTGVGGVDAAVDSGVIADSGVQSDSGVHPCDLEVSGNFDFGTISERRQVQSQLLTNIGFGNCEVTTLSIRDPLMFAVASGQAVVLAPGDAEQVQIETLARLGHLETELIITLRESRDGPVIRVPVSALRQGDELPSTEIVTFRVSNATTQDRWVHSAGWSCTPYDLEIPIDIEFQCGCECPAPPAPQVSELVRVPPGGQVDILWDGRSAVTWIERIECGPDQMQELRMARQPAAASVYNVRLGIEPTVPVNCNISGDTAQCTPDTSGQPGSAGGVANRCVSSSVLRESFVLVAGQDQVVPLTITN